jgi:hypothetical protein
MCIAIKAELRPGDVEGSMGGCSVCKLERSLPHAARQSSGLISIFGCVKTESPRLFSERSPSARTSKGFFFSGKECGAGFLSPALQPVLSRTYRTRFRRAGRRLSSRFLPFNDGGAVTRPAARSASPSAASRRRPWRITPAPGMSIRPWKRSARSTRSRSAARPGGLTPSPSRGAMPG